jgi:ornithine cyclodeaminase/alanine dehydrogenase-like protein (mu-crystallin family)
MGKRTEFLYMSEPDVIAAGVLDARMCVNNAEEVFRLLAQGDYLMGGSNHNNHGMAIVFPKETPFPNMPVAGPDRRFVAMPAYLGGRFNICGQKWYGSNAANKDKGLPRSVLMLTLNDKDSGEPLAYMSANLISAARTGAVPAVGARYLARKDAKVLTLIGCGPIGKACFEAIITELPEVNKVVCHNHSEAKAVSLATYIKKTYNLDAVVENCLETATREADVISVAASRTAPPPLQTRVDQAGLHDPCLRPAAVRRVALDGHGYRIRPYRPAPRLCGGRHPVRRQGRVLQQRHRRADLPPHRRGQKTRAGRFREHRPGHPGPEAGPDQRRSADLLCRLRYGGV